jgi:hypothetical protein
MERLYIAPQLRLLWNNADVFKSYNVDALGHEVWFSAVAPDDKAPGLPARKSFNYLLVTLDVIEAITSDAILNCASRSAMPWRRAIQAKSV